MNEQQSRLVPSTDVASPQVPACCNVVERVHTALTMAGSGLGAVFTTAYSATFLESQVAMAMGMIGAIGGALLATLITPIAIPAWFAISRRHGSPVRS